MTVNQESLMKPISIGYSAVNKERNSIYLEVVLAEATPFVSGELVDGFNTETIDGIAPDGSAQSFTIKTTNTIRAEWLGDSTNRISAPDVRRGEKLQIFQYSNVDKYYWQTVTQPGVNVRKKETIIEAISNTEDETQTQLTAENSWYKEFSTHDKRMTIKTNKSDGEKWAYTLQLDVNEGNLVFADDTGMFIQVNSEDETIELGTTSGGLVKMTKKLLEFDVDDWVVKSKTAKFNIDDFQQTSNKVNVTAPEGTYAIANGTWQGTISFTGGSGTFNGAVDFKNSVSHQGKSIGIDHKHSGVQTGTGNSSGVV